MNPTICICCNKQIEENNHALRRNPNMCLACENELDGPQDLEERHEDFRELATAGVLVQSENENAS